MSDEYRIPDIRDRSFDKVAGADAGVPPAFARQSALFSTLKSQAPLPEPTGEDDEEIMPAVPEMVQADQPPRRRKKVNNFKAAPAESPVKKTVTLADAGAQLEEILAMAPVSSVEIKTTIGSIKLPAKLVSLGEYSVAFFLQDDSEVEFTLGAKLAVLVKGELYNVFYAGGLHRFPHCAYHMMSFIIDKEVA